MKNVLIEFLDEEPLENVITCLHYRFDRVIFLGFSFELQKHKDSITSFLSGECGIPVEDVYFYPINSRSMSIIEERIRFVVGTEVTEGNRIFVDITGGESLPIFAMGRVAEEFKIPIHMYDIKDNRLIEVDGEESYKLSTEMEERIVPMTPERYFKLVGAAINPERTSSYFGKYTTEEIAGLEEITVLKELYLKNKYKWWQVIEGLVEADGTVSKLPEDNNYVYQKLLKKKYLIKSGDTFQYSEFSERALKKFGDALEIITMQYFAGQADYVMQSVTIDWDGELHLHANEQKDVENEIDVFAMKGNIPCFISCKAGNLEPDEGKAAIHELETFASKIAGKKYAEKYLVIAKNSLKDISIERARELGIRIIKFNKKGNFETVNE